MTIPTGGKQTSCLRSPVAMEIKLGVTQNNISWWSRGTWTTISHMVNYDTVCVKNLKAKCRKINVIFHHQVSNCLYKKTRNIILYPILLILVVQWEKSRPQCTVGFASRWMKNWREILKSITKCCNRIITYHSHLRTAICIIHSYLL